MNRGRNISRPFIQNSKEEYHLRWNDSPTTYKGYLAHKGGKLESLIILKAKGASLSRTGIITHKTLSNTMRHFFKPNPNPFVNKALIHTLESSNTQFTGVLSLPLGYLIQVDPRLKYRIYTHILRCFSFPFISMMLAF